MFFWCCGVREAKRKGEEPEPEPPLAETDWLLGGDEPVTYGDSIDKPDRKDSDLLRKIVRDAEGAMLNVSLETPFQFHSTPFEVPDDDSGLNGSVASYDYGDDHFSPGRRGRYNDRTSRRARSPHRRIRLQNGMNGAANGHGHASASRDTYRHGHRTSRSSSRDGSYASDYSSYSYEEDMYDYEEEDDYDPEEEAHLRRLRGPKLNVKMIPHPARQQEIEEEEERIAKEEADFRLGDGEVTPMQEHPSMSAVPPLLQIPDKIVVKPLSTEDKDAIVALSNALWTALEEGLRITDPPKIIHRWEDY